MRSELVVPLLHKSRSIGALNILSRQSRPVHRARRRDRLASSRRTWPSALVNARLFERSRLDAEAFETLAEIGREVASVLDLDELFARIAQLAKRVIDYRTFGILLVNDDNELEMKLAVKYGEKVEVPRVRARRRAGRLRRAAPRSGARARRVTGSALHQAGAGRALRAGDPDAAEGSLHRRRRSREPGARRLHASATSRSSRCSPARRRSRSRTRGCTKKCAPTQERLEKEVRFAQRVQAALLPAGPPKRLKGVELGGGLRARRASWAATSTITSRPTRTT